MNRAGLIFGTTNSFVAGRTEEDLESIYQQAYKPFVRALYAQPDVAATLHYSGTLLEWLRQRHSEFIDVLSELVSRRQVELLGGGFHEPILPLIPNQDRLGQIEMLTTYLRKEFGRRPRGAVITQHVWDQALVTAFKNSGIEYLFLDDRVFGAAGLTGPQLCEPCITEDQGKSVIVFPVRSRPLSELLEQDPERVVADVVAEQELSRFAVVSLMLDGSELGGSAGSFASCYEEGWLPALLKAFSETRAGRQPGLTHPYRYLRRHGSDAHRRTYFPSTTLSQYYQLQGLSPREPGTPGRSIRDLALESAEVRLLYAKMQHTHVLVNQIRGDKHRRQAGRHELWRAQTWGAYGAGWGQPAQRYRARATSYAALIQAEKTTRERGIFRASVTPMDFDLDGLPELLYHGPEINGYVHRLGGVLFELDSMWATHNYLDLAESRDGEEEVSVFRPPTTRRAYVDSLWSGTTMQWSGLNQLYELLGAKRDQGDFTLSAAVPLPQGEIELQKNYVFKRATVEVNTSLLSSLEEDLTLVLGQELNFAFASDSVDCLRVYERSGRGKRVEIGPENQTVSGQSNVLFEDRSHRQVLSVLASDRVDWDLERNVNREDGSFQGSRLRARFPVLLKAGSRVDVRLSLRIERA